MSFTRVFMSLKELFPEIDSRALRAAALEHTKDVDAAVVAVLEEIVPLFNKRSRPTTPYNPSINFSSIEALDRGDRFVSGNRQPSWSWGDAYSRHHVRGNGTAGLVSSMGTHEDRINMNANVHSQCESVVLMGDNFGEPCRIKVLGDPETEKPGSSIESKMDCLEEKEDVGDGTAQDISSTPSGSSGEVSGSSNMHGSNLDKLDSSSSTEAASGGEDMGNVIATEDESSAKAAMSSQTDIIDDVEEIIADARNNKITLNLELESVMKMMKEVELTEQAAEEAKSEALTVDMNLTNQIEEFKAKLQREKEAQDMRAGEVYGEKAVLATELRELQSRVRSLSTERDKSLADLEEMRQGLEVRFAAAVNEIKCAELKKVEQGVVARKSFAEQESMMEKVVQESKRLRQQAEDNSGLHKFLVDRGRTVDKLQGELAVVCQDVKKLKENFDQNVPLGKLLSSIHSSFVLASSTKSSKSMVPDQDETSTIRYDDQLMTENYANDETFYANEAAREDCKALEENDGWEFFDSREANS